MFSFYRTCLREVLIYLTVILDAVICGAVELSWVTLQVCGVELGHGLKCYILQLRWLRRSSIYQRDCGLLPNMPPTLHKSKCLQETSPQITPDVWQEWKNVM